MCRQVAKRAPEAEARKREGRQLRNPGSTPGEKKLARAVGCEPTEKGRFLPVWRDALHLQTPSIRFYP